MLYKGMLTEMKELKGEWCVSLYLSLSCTNIQKNRRKLRNLMFETEEKLIELRTPVITVAKMLLPIEKILDNNQFWKDKKSGLAIFLTPTTFNWHLLNHKVEELAVISNQFYLKPLRGFQEEEIKTQDLVRSSVLPETLAC